MSIYSVTSLCQTRNSKCIRLLELSTDEKSPLEGTLIVVSLKSRITFYALSYVWGAFDDPPYRIHCRTGSGSVCTDIPITENCYDALAQVRHSYGKAWWSDGNIRLWVDAICINQADNEEKAHQIPLMEQIYGNASRVLIWLGKGNASSDNAMEWISRTGFGQSPLLRARWKNYPGNMYPSEVWRLARLLPEIVQRCQCTTPKSLFTILMIKTDCI